MFGGHDQQDAIAKKERRGFARLTTEERKRIASLGGKRAHQLRRAHRFTSEEARVAGSKGGQEAARRMRLGNDQKGGGDGNLA